eukprot:6213585-Pleurochrysis_carterae.AAC.5
MSVHTCAASLSDIPRLFRPQVPNTLKKAAPRPGPPGRAPPEGERRGPPRDGGREGYRCALLPPRAPSFSP